MTKKEWLKLNKKKKILFCNGGVISTYTLNDVNWKSLVKIDNIITLYDDTYFEMGFIKLKEIES